MKRNKDRLIRDLWDNGKCTNIWIIGVSEGGEREKGPEKTFKDIIAVNFPNLRKEIVTQDQEAHSPRQDKPKEEHSETHSNKTGKN